MIDECHWLWQRERHLWILPAWLGCFVGGDARLQWEDMQRKWDVKCEWGWSWLHVLILPLNSNSLLSKTLARDLKVSTVRGSLAMNWLTSTEAPWLLTHAQIHKMVVARRTGMHLNRGRLWLIRFYPFCFSDESNLRPCMCKMSTQLRSMFPCWERDKGLDLTLPRSTSRTTKVPMCSLGAILISLRVNTGSEDSGLIVFFETLSRDKVMAHVSLKCLKIQRRGYNRKFKPPEGWVVIWVMCP